MTKREKCSTTQVDRVLIHKKDVEKRIYKNELSSYEACGWKLGISDTHRKNNSISHKGKKAPNKGVQCSESTKNKISNSLKGNIPWNKGLSSTSDERIKKYSEKAKNTKIKKYGSAFSNNNMSKEHKEKIGASHRGVKELPLSKDKLLIKTTKQYLTRKKNNTFNTSGSEESLYENLLTEYCGKTIYRQYKDDKRYPYYCDFYIVEDDLFIELNAHWTHGGHPFDSTNKDDIDKLNCWKAKACKSNFYRQAINTWTKRDVEKQLCAKKNNLNYKVIY